MTSTTATPARNHWPAFVLGALLGLPLASPVPVSYTHLTLPTIYSV